jgi:hypothetical protein
MFDHLSKWWKSHHSISASEMLAVEFDDEQIRVRVLDGLGPEWNQTLSWSNIKRVCWKDGGVSSSDLIYISKIQPDEIVVVPAEARGGHEFFGALCNRQLFPEEVWRRALGDTGGGMHCWPPVDQ